MFDYFGFFAIKNNYATKIATLYLKIIFINFGITVHC